MADKREKFSPVTILLHWAIGLAIITLLGVGIYMADLPRGEWKSTLYGWHKVLGTTVLMVAALRIVWRWRNGLPLPAGDYTRWQHQLANATHIVLLAATIAMPVSGAIYSYAAGYPVPILGLFTIGPPAAKIVWLADPAKFVHGWAGWILAGIVALHVMGALKHHMVDKDGTLRRMLGARVSP